MRTLKTSLLSLGIFAALSSPVAAQTVTFDDIISTPFNWFTNYNGLSWSNSYIIDPTAYFGGVSGGFGTALQSGNYVAGNGGGNPLSISGSAFNLLSGTFSAGWRKGVTLTAAGYNSGVQLYSQSYTLDWDDPQSLDLNMFGVDNVVFSSFGGTIDGFDSGNNSGFAMDDLTFGEPRNQGLRSFGVLAVDVVPEPMSVSLMAAGLLGVGMVSARRRRKTA